MSEFDAPLSPPPYPDLAVAPSAAAAIWLSQSLQPILQSLILILTLAFLGLGVALRWRQLRRSHGRYDLDSDETDHNLHS